MSDISQAVIPGYLNEQQAAQRLDAYRTGKRPVTVTRIRYWIRSGMIPHVQLLGMTLIPETQLIDWVGSLPIVYPARSPKEL